MEDTSNPPAVERQVRIFFKNPVSQAQSKVVTESEFRAMPEGSHFAAEFVDATEPAPPDAGYLVHLADAVTGMATGETVVWSHDELIAADPKSYTTIEPADRHRFIVLDRIVDRTLKFVVHDRFGMVADAGYDTAAEADTQAVTANGDPK